MIASGVLAAEKIQQFVAVQLQQFVVPSEQ
jgi:hypothetical protein